MNPNRNVSLSAIYRLVKKWKETSNVADKKKSGRKNTSFVDIEEAVMNCIRENPRQSTRSVASIVETTQWLVLKVLKKNKLKAWKPSFHHQILARDHESRLRFCVWFAEQRRLVRNLEKYILFTDEATFNTNGVVSAQNQRHWSVENPNWIIENRSQYSHSVNVGMGGSIQ